MKAAGQGSGLNLAKEVISARGERERFGSNVVVGTERIPLKPPASKSPAVKTRLENAGVVFIPTDYTGGDSCLPRRRGRGGDRQHLMRSQRLSDRRSARRLSDFKCDEKRSR